jgi:hypothetical protein
MDKGLTRKPPVLGGKEEHRKILRDLPFPEKVRIVVELQKIAAPTLRARGINVHPWRI